jgi:heme/copper-type cytochrome/quinol oxidase subunit 2
MNDEKPRFLSVDNNLYLPVYTKILFIVTSEDVIHSFSIPDVGIKVDAIPGRLAVVDAFFISEGSYKGQCSELCGANHAFMPISIVVISRASYFSSIMDISILFDFMYSNTDICFYNEV